MSLSAAGFRNPIPWRTIWATIGSVVLAVAGIALLNELHRILVWIAVAGFLAVVLNPAVDLIVRRGHLRRGLATLVVCLAALGIIAAIGFAFVQPLVSEGRRFADDFPTYVEEARRGEGPVGGIVTRFDLEERITAQQETFRSSFDDIGSQSMRVLGTVGNVVAGTLTVLVLTILMLLEGPRLIAAGMQLLPEERRERVSRVAGDCSKAVTGYMFGNLLISVIAGVVTYVFLLIADVPFPAVLALFVAVMDLVPLVGATVGAVVVTLVAFLVSPAVGIAAIVFFVVYQQLENHVLQPVIQSKTVDLSPLVVLVSVLVGVELAGLLGALLAIPVAGVVKVIARDVWDGRNGTVKAEPTVGVDEVPVSESGDAAPFVDLTDDGERVAAEDARPDEQGIASDQR